MKKPITSWGKFLKAFGYKVNWNFNSPKKRKSKSDQDDSLTFEKLQARELLAVTPPAPYVEFDPIADIETEGFEATASVRMKGIHHHAGKVTVEIAYVPGAGTATLGADFEFETTQVILNGFQSQEIKIPHLVDGLTEGQEDYFLEIVSVTSHGPSILQTDFVEIGDDNIFRGIIEDPAPVVDDPPTSPAYVEFVEPLEYEVEGLSLYPMLQLSHTNLDLNEVSATVRYVPDSGTAVEGLDFQFQTQTVYFNSAGYSLMEVPHLNDLLIEGPENYVLEIVSVTGPNVYIGNLDHYEGIIVDATDPTGTEDAYIKVTAPDRFARELSENQTTPVDTAFFTFSRGENGGSEPIQIVYELHGSGVTESEGEIRTLHLSGNEIRKSISLVPASSNPTGSLEIGLESLSDDGDVEWDQYVKVRILSAKKIGPDGRPLAAPLGHAGQNTVRILDTDGISSTSPNRNVDFDSTGLVRSSTSVGPVDIDLQDGTVELMLNTPHGIVYNGSNQLYPIIDVQAELPDYSLDDLSATVIFGFERGQEREFDLTPVLTDQEIHLVVMASENVAQRYWSGRYGFDVILKGTSGDSNFTRTYVGAQEFINTSIAGQGDEFGVGWRHSEIDRLYFDDGFSGRFTRKGLSPESGLALIRGDNTSAFYAGEISSTNHTLVDPVPSVESQWKNPAAPGADYLYTDSDSFSQPGDDPKVSWELDVERNKPFQLFTEWTPDFDRSFDARYEVIGATPLGPNSSKVINVDQRYTPADFTVDGVRWRSLGWFIADQADPPADDPNNPFPNGDPFYDPNNPYGGGGPGGGGTGGDPEPESTTATIQLELVATNENLITVAGKSFVAQEYSYETPDGSNNTLVLQDTLPTIHEYVPSDGGFVLKNQYGQQHVFSGTGIQLAKLDRFGNQSRYLYADKDNDQSEDELVTIIRQGGLKIDYHYDGEGYLNAVTDLTHITVSDIELPGRITSYVIDGQKLTNITLPDTGDAQSMRPEFNFDYNGLNQLNLVSQKQNEQTNINTEIQYDSDTKRVNGVKQLGQNSNHIETLFQSTLVDAFHHSRVTGTGNIGFGNDPSIEQAVAVFRDGRGNEWTYQVDAYGLMTAMAQPVIAGSTIPGNQVWTYDRNQHGLLTQSTQPAGGGGDGRFGELTTLYTRNDGFNLDQITHPDSTFEKWTYDPTFNQVTRYVRGSDSLSEKTVYELDSNNRTVESMVEHGTSNTSIRRTHFTYTSAPDGSIGQIEGGLGRSVTVASGSIDSVTSWTEYHESGPFIGLIDQTIANGNPDPANPVASNSIVTQRFTYSPMRHVQTSTDALDSVTTFIVDNLGQTIHVIEPATQQHASHW